MGATSFFMTAKAKSVEEAFDELVEQAKYERGHDGYNGTISTCSLRGVPVKVFKKYLPENRRLAREIAESEDYGEKRVAKYIDLGICGYELVEVKRTKYANNAKYQLVYAIYDENFKWVASCTSKVEAEEVAIKYALKHNCDCYVKKEYKKTEGNDRVFDVEVKRKFYLPEDKPRFTRNPNKTLTAIHEYAFYGLACR